MKKSLLIISLIAAMSIAACGKKEEAQPAETTPAPAPAAAMPTSPDAAPAAPQAQEPAPAHPADAAQPQKQQ